MEIRLEIILGPSAGRTLELTPGQLVQVGRASWAEFSLPNDRSLAGQHFALECEQDKCMLRALSRTLPTLLNGGPVREAELRDGDRITAGDNTFLVHITAGPATSVAPAAPVAEAVPEPAPTMKRESPPPTMFSKGGTDRPLPVPPATPLPGARNDLLRVLRNAQPLYAVLDAARDEKILEVLKEEIEPYQSLYEGDKARELAEAAPYVVRLPPTSALLETLVREGWGESWGIYLVCNWPLADVRKHLRRFLMVELEGEGQVYFRYYDPRVLRAFLPTCTAEEVAEFFGPVRAFLMEDRVPEILLKFSSGKQGAKQDLVVLGLQAPAGAGTPGS
jgi:hypothetical protein